MLFVIFLSALIIINITYHLNSQLKGLSIWLIIDTPLSALRCLSYRMFHPLYVSHRIALDNVVPNIALVTCPSGLNIVAGVPSVFSPMSHS